MLIRDRASSILVDFSCGGAFTSHHLNQHAPVPGQGEDAVVKEDVLVHRRGLEPLAQLRAQPVVGGFGVERVQWQAAEAVAEMLAPVQRIGAMRLLLHPGEGQVMVVEEVVQRGARRRGCGDGQGGRGERRP